MKGVILKTKKVKLFQNGIGVKRDLELGDVASGVGVERTIAFDEGVVIVVVEVGESLAAPLQGWCSIAADWVKSSIAQRLSLKLSLHRQLQ